MITKIEMTPEVREFNECVETVDALLDFKHDTKSAEELLKYAIEDGHIPCHAEWLANAMAAISIKR